jgi:hypothetical protein
MSRRQFLLIVGMKSPIAMVGRQIILAMGEGLRNSPGQLQHVGRNPPSLILR